MLQSAACGTDLTNLLQSPNSKILSSDRKVSVRKRGKKLSLNFHFYEVFIS